jgi:serine/threonine-protein kinase
MSTEPSEKGVSARAEQGEKAAVAESPAATSDFDHSQPTVLNLAGTKVDAPQTGARVANVDAYTLLRDAQGPVTIGDYEIQTKLGQGGMGAVYKARQISLDREVALKILARHLVDDAKFVHRFQREARVMARLDHPNIIRCHNVHDLNGLHCLAMEFVDGCSLQNLVDDHGKFSISDALYVATCVAGALQYAHELNLVHRDIKPDNILVTKKGMIKVADLGLAKPVNDDLSMTASGVGAGTPHYMAPEQMRSAKDVDARADIYALGAMLYVMLTGKKPHEGESLVKLLEQKEKGRIDPVRKSNPNVPERLDLMIEKMLDKNLKTRYQTCAEVVHDLNSLGLTGRYLSLLFPQGPPPGVAHAPPVVPSKARPAPAKPPSAPYPPVPAPASTPAAAEAPAGDTWYIEVGTLDDGRKKVRRLSQAKLRELIKTDKIDSTTQASRQAATGYRAIATFKEFDLLFRVKLAEKRAERKAVKLQNKYDEIEAELETYERRKKWGRFLNSLGGWIALLLVLLVLAGFVYLLITFGPDIVHFIAKKLGAA